MSKISPNEQLSIEVSIQLVAAGLLKPHREQQVRFALVNGKCKAGDWKIWAEDFTREEKPE